MMRKTAKLQGGCKCLYLFKKSAIVLHAAHPILSMGALFSVKNMFAAALFGSNTC